MKTNFSREEELKCFEQYYKTKDLNCLTPVLKGNEQLILSKLRKSLQYTNMELEDLLQHIYTVILSKIKKFNYKKYRFSTYFCSTFIQWELNKIHTSNSRERRGITNHSVSLTEERTEDGEALENLIFSNQLSVESSVDIFSFFMRNAHIGNKINSPQRSETIQLRKELKELVA